MYSFRNITPSAEIWQQIESAAESTCFHTHQWSQYLHSIGYEPYVIEVVADGAIIGYFVGERIWRGVWLLTAPFEGIGSYTQGLVLFSPINEEERVAIYRAIASWAFQNHVAAYMQVDDWQLRRDLQYWIPDEDFHQEILEKLNQRYEFRPTLYLDMAGKSEEELWSMQHYKSCKYSVNKARKLGLTIRQITNPNELDAFCKIHYDQLYEVCKNKNTHPKPSQSRARMKALCQALMPDRVIMLECVGPDENGIEQVMSTGIFCPDKGESIYWTGASYQRYQRFCPNELMVWEAIRLLQQRGAGALNFGGIAAYKLKFGTIYAYVPRLIFTKFEFIYQCKNVAKHTYHQTRDLLARLKNVLKNLY